MAKLCIHVATAWLFCTAVLGGFIENSSETSAAARLECTLLASKKSGQILTSCNVQASVPKHAKCQKYFLRDTLHFQLLLLIGRANSVGVTC